MMEAIEWMITTCLANHWGWQIGHLADDPEELMGDEGALATVVGKARFHVTIYRGNSTVLADDDVLQFAIQRAVHTALNSE